MLLERELTEIHRRLGRRTDGAGPELGPQDETDEAVTGEIRELDARERGRLEFRARRIAAALRRVRAGEYGRCVDCGEPIAPARLRAIPEAEYCRDCAERAERDQATDGAAQRIARPLVERLDEEGR